MHIEFLVEEPSAEVALGTLAPRILGPSHTYDVRRFNGKHDLLGKLEGRLKGYKPWLPSDWRIVVLVDRDNDDCRDLKRTLDQTAVRAGLTVRTNAGSGAQLVVLNRLAIEELEAWFFGDIHALC